MKPETMVVIAETLRASVSEAINESDKKSSENQGVYQP